jgi:hypothetical protein
MLPLLHPGLSSEGKTPPGSRAANRNPGHAQLHVDLGYVSGTLPDLTLVRDGTGNRPRGQPESRMADSGRVHGLSQDHEEVKRMLAALEKGPSRGGCLSLVSAAAFDTSDQPANSRQVHVA